MPESVLVEPDALLEREAEVERVRGALRAVGRREGVVIVIEGAAGIGKSRLLEIARARGADLGFRVLSARGTELEQGFPFGAVRQLFERLIGEADGAERDRWLSGAAGLAADVVTGIPTSMPPAPVPGPAADDPSYAWQHGLYWLASNLSADSPLVLAVDDFQWCDAPSARAIAFIARRLGGQAIALLLATRPLDPGLMPDAASLTADPTVELLRPAPLTRGAVAVVVARRLAAEPDAAFVRACLEVTGGNPFLLGELLDEASARGFEPTVGAAADVESLVPRGVANTVLLRLARLATPAAALARTLSVLGDGAQVTDAVRLSGLDGLELEAAMTSLITAGVIQPGGTARFTHPILRAAIYGDLSPAERERLHCSASKILGARGAPAGQVAAHVMQTEPGADPEAVKLLREAAHDALALGDAGGAARFLARALDEPPGADERRALVLELGLARARAGAPEAIGPLTEIVTHAEDAQAIVTAAIELSGMLFFAGRAGEAVSILRRAQERLPPGAAGRERLEVALLGASYMSASARREADSTIAALRDPGGPARSVLEATTLATLGMDELMYLRSAAKARDYAQRALAAGLPFDPYRGEGWGVVALAVLAATDEVDAAIRGIDEILARARERGGAVSVTTLLALRAFFGVWRGDLTSAQTDAYAAIELAQDLLGTEFVLLGVTAAVLAGLERDETPESLRRLIDRVGIRYDTEFSPSSQLRYASAAVRAAAGNHEAAVEELRACELDHPALGVENPAVLAWRSAAALSLAELGRFEEARGLAADELRRSRSFGTRRAIGIALRVDALVGPASRRAPALQAALEVLEASPDRLAHARVLVDLGATLRAARQRTAAREPLLEGLAMATRCGARRLERRARAELAAIGVRPRTAERSGTDSLTPSERRVAELAAAGQTNREIAQTLFVTEKTVETHLGRAFRKLDVTSRRQLPDVLASASR
ncbi:MAG: AAA family ATPase [Solirubrobacterales bacterium]|nr:AAA family ATPase [Solirubrobacterales bacterium]MBV9682153.1 AAA family ATPase [Solirubrobacterales bacterium]